MKFNKSHVNKQVIHKIIRASRIALKRGTVEPVLNSKGHAFLAVRPVKRIDGKQGFTVLDSTGQNIMKHLLIPNLKKIGLNPLKGCGQFIFTNILWPHQIKGGWGIG